jgi:putative serine protease PepD
MDDDQEDGRELGPPPPPDDRLWRHPSEIGSTQPIRIVTTRPKRSRMVLIGVVSSLVGAAAMLVALVATGSFDHQRPTVAVEQVRMPLAFTPTALKSVTARVTPALVRVDATTANGTTSATAVVFRSDGYLLTTAEVVKGMKTLTVQLSDGTTLPGQLLGVDDPSDVAVVKVARTQMATAVLTDEDDIQLGEPAIAVDCIMGRPSAPDVSVGLVSALGRQFESQDRQMLLDMIQTNVNLSGTSAGAALVDSSGSVIGLITSTGAHLTTVSQATTTTGTASANQTLVSRYATPIAYAKQVADELILTGHVSHPWLGVEATDLTTDQANSLGRTGAHVDRVITKSPAQRAGLLPGDVVIAIDSSRITSEASLIVHLRQEKPHQSITVTYMRDGTQRVTTAVLIDRDSDS